MNCDVSGEGQPMVLVPGLGCDSRMWGQVVDRVEVPLKVVVPRSWEAETMAEAADTLARGLDALNIEKTICAGLSMGGYVVMEFMRRHPGRVAGALLADTTAFPDDAGRLANRDRVLKLLADGAFDDVLGTFVKSVLWNEGPRFGLARDFILGMCRDLGPANYERSLKAIRNRGDYLDVLTGTEIPLLFVSGEHDAMSPPSLAEKMASMAKRGDWAVIGDAGHMTAVENPGAMARCMTDFVRGLILPG